LQRGTKTRPAEIIDRKNEEAYVLELPQDVVEAIRWHSQQGYSGEDFLFSKSGNFPRYMDSHRRPMRAIQKAMGLREISHHAFGRHSVASQAVTSGHSIKAVQAQLGHRSEQSTHVYAHLGSRAQLRLVEGLQPAAAPHGTLRAPSKKKGT
jgi:site-specific recombinase XerD